MRVQLKTDVETVEETEEKPKHYRFTLIEFCTRETAKLEARINGSLAKWIEEARRIATEKAGEKTAEEKYDEPIFLSVTPYVSSTIFLREL